ncbi:type II toxin-antitoxin system VapC family toxin [Haloplanus halobius]|uniref:type II toxin-antitoxin system VapC family toxin n=1 Tax=Haloplanus halobius TaxID=2934938 RepID=UPI00200CA9B8|nr:PIN domain-containing protein [Haloplanus sp. XH21]
MPVALLDTNVLFASASARDDYHNRAQEIVRGIDHGDLPDVMVTNYVVAETLNLTGEKLGPDAANEMLNRLIEGAHFEIDHAPKTDFNAAQALFRRYLELSFVDSTIAAYMEREGIEYLYSFDDDFDALDGVTRLDTADNPFN